MNVLGVHCNRLEHLTTRLLGLGFTRGEFYNFVPDHLPTVKQFIREHGIVPSVHCPLRKAPWYPHPVTWSFLTTDVHHAERQLSLRLVEQALQDAQDIGATYMVVHYPTPASDRAGEMSLDEQYAVAWDSARRLNEWAQSFAIPIHIEGFGPSPFLTPDFLCQILTAFRNLRYCFDTGHMQIAAQRDGLDYFAFLERLAPYLGSLHIWNTRGMDDYRAYHHLSVHPQLDPAAGWVDIERVVRTVRAVNPCVPFVLEFSDSFPAEFGLNFEAGIEWFKELVNSQSGQPLGRAAPTGGSCRKNLVLSGFMGTGKTQVGRAVAERLGRPFVDMDHVIEARFGMPTWDIFEQRGEPFFREQEALLCRELSGREGLVIATGGGALASDTNREVMQARGVLVCLSAEPEEIIRRLKAEHNGRPMLKGDDLSRRVSALLAQRRAAYAAIPHQVDTTGLTIEQVADAVVALWWRGAEPSQPAAPDCQVTR
jgi:shikimate kinase